MNENIQRGVLINWCRLPGGWINDGMNDRGAGELIICFCHGIVSQNCCEKLWANEDEQI